MTVHVESATIEDVETVRAQWIDLVEGQRQYGTHLLAAENATAARSIIEQYVHSEGLAVARSEDREVLGFVMFHVENGLYEQDARRGIVDNLYVVPSWRGDRIGSRLLEYAEGALEERGVDVVALSVMAANDEVADWYRRRGYEAHRITLERSVESDDG